ncbi:MAG TPA: PAS domain S-box protein [Cytophagaceae bacterium]
MENSFRKFVDINRARRKLAINDNRYRTVIQTAIDPIIIADEECDIIFCNKKALEVFGYDEQELIGHNLDILIPEKLKEKYRERIQFYLSSEITDSKGSLLEIQGCRKNGTIFPIELSLSFWKEEQRTYFSVIIRDITERKRIYEALELLQSITESINAANDFNDALKTTIEKVCKTIKWNYGEAWIPRKDKKKLLLAPVTYYQTELLKEFAAQCAELTFNSNEGIPGYVYQNNIIWIDDISTYHDDNIVRKELISRAGLKACLGIPVYGKNKVIAVILLFKQESMASDEKIIKLVSSIAKQLGEVLLRKKAEKNLLLAKEKLAKKVEERTAELTRTNQILQEEIKIRNDIEESLRINNEELIKTNNDLDNFVYIASHDLKVPLINMEVLFNLLKNEYKPDKEEFNIILYKVEQSIKRMKQTLIDITEVAKAQKNFKENIEQITFEDEVEQIKASIEEMIRMNNAQIYFDFSQCPTINYSRLNLKSILYNFITNAIKYRSMERTPEIFIQTEQKDNFILLTIRDNGLGIDLERNGDKLFGLFKRFHDHVEGSGIGLYIIKKIVENNEGWIDVESKLGTGTTFKVYLKSMNNNY